MKFAVITSKSYLSYLILSHLLSEHREKIACVIEARGMIQGKRMPAMLREVYRRSGLRGFSYKIGTAAYSRLLDRLTRFIPGSKRDFSPLSHARRLTIPVRTFTDANSAACLEQLRAVEPDLIFGVNVYQKLKPALLRLPKIGVVNCHFGMLPNYRGMSPYMWALAHGETEMGVTAHFMDEAFDTGDIIIQELVPIEKHDSAYALYLRGCLVAREILERTARLAEQGRIPRRPQPKQGSYYSLPGPDCVREIRRHGHKLCRLRDLWTVFTGRIERESGERG